MTLPVLARVHRASQSRRDEGGFAVAEILAVGALSVVALVVIFGAVQALGLDIVAWMRQQLLGA
jgi:hypothetical protein